LTTTEGAFIASSAVTLVEAGYLLLSHSKRHDRLTFGLFFLAWSILTLSFAIHLQPQGNLYSAGVILFAVCAPLIPTLWLLVTAVWGRDTRNDRFLSRNRGWLFFSFTVSTLLTVLIYIDPIMEYVPGTLYASPYFQMTGYSFLLFLFYLTAFLFGLYNIENCYRTAIGSQKQKLQMGVHVLLVLTGFIFFMATLGILYHRVAIWILLTTAIAVPLLGLILTMRLVKYDPAKLGVVVTRRSAHASTVIFLGGGYFLGVGLLSKMIFSYGLAADLLMSIIAGLLVLSLLLCVFVFSMVRRRKLAGRGESSLKGMADIKEFIEDVSIYKSVAEIIERVRLFLETDYGIKEGALIEKTDGQRYAVVYFDKRSSRIESTEIQPLVDWLYRYGRPIVYEDLNERTSDSEADSGVLASRLGFELGLVVPIISRQKMVGLLVLGLGSNDPRELQSISRFLETAAGPLALAIHNSRVTDQLIKAHEMESFHKISSFVLHDLKNSVGMLDLLLTNAKKNMDNPEFRSSMLTTIGDAVRRQRRIISRLSEPLSEEALSVSELNINDLLQRVIDKVQVRKIERIELSETYADVPTVHTDKQKLSSVFENLIVNAIEAMPVSGKLQIETKPASHGNDKRTVVVSVADTGKGMSREFIETKLFRPFTSTKKKGLGIGMYQSYEAVRQLGGEITVVSEEGKGSRFDIVLPV
jgi:putative PEP-CTERM system histidine kinase